MDTQEPSQNLIDGFTARKNEMGKKEEAVDSDRKLKIFTKLLPNFAPEKFLCIFHALELGF